jgi:hypothetical protein
MKDDYHLTLTEIPVHNGFSYDVLCRRTIERASFGFVWDQVDMLSSARMLNLRGVCSKCWQAFLDRPHLEGETLRYLSAIRSAKTDEQDMGEVA